MRVLTAGHWREGYLDYHKGSDEVRVCVTHMLNLRPIEGLYFVRPLSGRLLTNYVSEIGLREVARKVASRWRERGRNEKWLSSGIGIVEESDDRGALERGAVVMFIAPCHPPCVERLCLPARMVWRPEHPGSPAASGDSVLLLQNTSNMPEVSEEWRDMAGWSPYSGVQLNDDSLKRVRQEAAALVTSAPWDRAQRLPTGRSCAVRERLSPRPGVVGRQRAAVFGYGHYAKTVIIPNIRKHLDVVSVHEIDPTQIGRVAGGGWDTIPVLRDDEEYDACFIAGFHHTHAPLATAALRAGACAVVEKPIATSWEQLRMLEEVLDGGARLFCGFQKRYLPFNDAAVRDLGVPQGDPVSYHCIVYEVPLPELHWYRWPNSGSRLISNGCHWVDHFLYLNGFGDVEMCDVQCARDGTINCSLELRNGAIFTMVLTDKGSDRTGVQDYVELRAGRRTARMINGSLYEAEYSDRLVRRLRTNKMQSYREMYTRIAERIQRGEPGDSLRAVVCSARVVLALDDQLAVIQQGRQGAARKEDLC